jgi:membrane-associated phospholipid phosphatase
VSSSVLQRHLGWKGTAAYLVSSYVAMSRLHESRHYLSDVVFGSTLGLIVGRTITRHGARNYALLPIPAPGGGAGVMIAAGF